MDPVGALELSRRELRRNQLPLRSIGSYDEIHAGSVVERTLLDYLSVVWLHKWVLSGILFVGAVGGYLAGLPQIPMFRSSTLLEIQEPNAAFLNMREIEPTTATPLPGSYLNTQVQVLRSKTLRSQVAERLAASQFRHGTQPAGKLNALLNRFQLPAVLPEATSANAIQTANSTLSIRVVGDTQLLEISCESTNPDTAAGFVNGLVSEYIAHQLDSRSASSEQTRNWLDNQIADLRKKLHDSEEAVLRYARDSALMIAGGTSNLGEERLRSLQQDLSAAQSDLIVKKSRQQVARTVPVDSLPEVMNDADLRANQARLAEVRSQKAALEATLTPEHYKVVALQNQIDEIEAVLNRTRQNILRRINNEHESAKVREQAIEAAYSRQAAVLATQQASMAEYNMLRRDVDSNRLLLDSLLQKVKTARIAAGLRASNVHVLDAAVPANRPHKPNVQRNVLTGLGVSLVLGIVFIVVSDQRNRKVRAPGEVSRISDVPELGVVPSLESRHYVTGSTQEQDLLGDNGENKSVELMTWAMKPSLQAEAVRAVIASILAARERVRTLAVTSPHGREGKTVISCNLAIAFTETHRRVLLVDADLRQPRLHSIFDLPNTFGLSDILSGKHDIRAHPLNSLVRQTAIEGLHVLPSGPGSPHITRLLYSPRAAELFRRLQESFDMIVIDTPPALLLADARVLARRSDGVVLVFRAGQTSMQSAHELLCQMERDRTPVLGTILNDWKPKHGYGSRHYGGYYYRSMKF
jgi:capsular exopolysaccharide synthesis family protein